MEFCGWEIGGGGGNTRDRKDWNFLQVQLEDYGERWQPVGGWENYSQRMQRSPIWLTNLIDKCWKEGVAKIQRALTLRPRLFM